jgi:hypothetical protein
VRWLASCSFAATARDGAGSVLSAFANALGPASARLAAQAESFVGRALRHQAAKDEDEVSTRASDVLDEERDALVARFEALERETKQDAD